MKGCGECWPHRGRRASRRRRSTAACPAAAGFRGRAGVCCCGAPGRGPRGYLGSVWLSPRRAVLPGLRPTPRVGISRPARVRPTRCSADVRSRTDVTCRAASAIDVGRGRARRLDGPAHARARRPSRSAVARGDVDRRRRGGGRGSPHVEHNRLWPGGVGAAVLADRAHPAHRLGATLARGWRRRRGGAARHRSRRLSDVRRGGRARRRRPAASIRQPVALRRRSGGARDVDALSGLAGESRLAGADGCPLDRQRRLGDIGAALADPA